MVQKFFDIIFITKWKVKWLRVARHRERTREDAEGSDKATIKRAGASVAILSIGRALGKETPPG